MQIEDKELEIVKKSHIWLERHLYTPLLIVFKVQEGGNTESMVFVDRQVRENQESKRQLW